MEAAAAVSLTFRSPALVYDVGSSAPTILHFVPWETILRGLALGGTYHKRLSQESRTAGVASPSWLLGVPGPMELTFLRHEGCWPESGRTGNGLGIATGRAGLCTEQTLFCMT